MEKIRYEKYSEMGMETINAFYKGVFMNLAEGDDWVSIYLCESKNKGKGEVQEMIGLLKNDFKGKTLNGSVPLNPVMEHIYAKCGVFYLN
jgi:hypothetical protein